jgi:colicin import membrane protein
MIVPHPLPQRSSLWAGVLSVSVHIGLLLFLVMGVSWRNVPSPPLQAEIWARMPDPASAPVLDAPPEPPPRAEIKKPDIALAHAAKAVKKPRPESPVNAPQSKREQQAREEKREQARRQFERTLAEEERAEAAAEAAQIEAARRRMETQAHTASQLKTMALREAQDRVRLKIRGLLRIPEGIKGNPEVVYLVRLFPNGEIMGVPERLRSSGQPAYDEAVERALLKASPFPMPSNASAVADFRLGLELHFRPRD